MGTRYPYVVVQFHSDDPIFLKIGKIADVLEKELGYQRSMDFKAQCQLMPDSYQLECLFRDWVNVKEE